MCHGQKSSIRGMIIQNPWSGIRKYRYNMHMICKFIQIHLHPHPTLENPYKWLYNAIYIYIHIHFPYYSDIQSHDLNSPSFGKRSHHDTMVSKGALEAMPSSTAQKWNVLLQRSKRCTAQKYGTWCETWRLWLTFWPPWWFLGTPLGKNVGFFGGWIVFLLCLSGTF